MAGQIIQRQALIIKQQKKIHERQHIIPYIALSSRRTYTQL